MPGSVAITGVPRAAARSMPECQCPPGQARSIGSNAKAVHPNPCEIHEWVSGFTKVAADGLLATAPLATAVPPQSPTATSAVTAANARITARFGGAPRGLPAPGLCASTAGHVASPYAHGSRRARPHGVSPEP